VRPQPKEVFSESSSDEEEIVPGGQQVHDLLGLWGIPLSLRGDALERPNFYRLNVGQMKQIVRYWADEENPVGEFVETMERAMGVRMPAELEKRVRAMERMFVPFFERDEMVRAMEEMVGRQDWDSAGAMVFQIIERQRETGERSAELIFAADDDEAVLALQAQMEEAEANFEAEMAQSERKADRRAQGLPSESDDEGGGGGEDGGALPPGWTAVEDGEGGQYYWHEETDETSWDKPTLGSGGGGGGGGGEGAGAALADAAPGEEAAAAETWEPMDDGAGNTFFYNPATGESKWEQ